MKKLNKTCHSEHSKISISPNAKTMANHYCKDSPDVRMSKKSDNGVLKEKILNSGTKDTIDTSVRSRKGSENAFSSTGKSSLVDQ